MVFADVCLDRIFGVEGSVTVGTRYGLALHVLALYVPLKTVSVLHLLIANVATPVAGLQLLHLQVAPG